MYTVLALWFLKNNIDKNLAVFLSPSIHYLEILCIFVSFNNRCHWETEIGVYLEQRCCSPAYHLISPGGPQSKHFSVSCGWSRCRIWKSNVCLSGNGLWGNRDQVCVCAFLSLFLNFSSYLSAFLRLFSLLFKYCIFSANRSFIYSKCLTEIL